jgi:hypothetical protein
MRQKSFRGVGPYRASTHNTIDIIHALGTSLQSGRETHLQLKHPTYPIHRHPHQIFLLVVVLIHHFDQDFQPTTTNKHLQLSEKKKTESIDDVSFKTTTFFQEKERENQIENKKKERVQRREEKKRE